MFDLLRSRSVAALCLTATLFGSAACAAPSAAPAASMSATAATFSCEPLIQPQAAPASTALLPAWNDCFVPRQFLATGPKDVLDAAAKANGFTRLQRLDLAPLQDLALSRGFSLALPRFPGTVMDLAIDLYEIPEGKGEVSEIVQAFNQDARGDASANPNYLISDLVPLKGSPWIPGGSPAGGGSAAAGVGLFTNQWAFNLIDVTPAANHETGEAVRVGVFDTFPVPWPASDAVSPYRFRVTEGEGNLAGLSLCVKTPVRMAEIEVAGNAPGAPEPIPDHGIFAAGLVQAVAPQTKIYLYQVLDERGAGDLATLQRALLDFAHGGDFDGKPSVVNLSLGLHWYPDKTWPKSRCGDWIDDYGSIQSLESTLDLARQAGAVVVAAAGNNANNANNETQDADIPAGWPGVIGVSAANRDGRLSCFSNKGDVSAPGGEGWDVAGQKCGPPFDRCGAACGDYGVVSLVTGETSNTGFAYWAGTSFAAPLVSGLAARVLQAPGYTALPLQAAQEAVANVITSSATPLTGAIESGPVISVTSAIELVTP